MYELVGVYNANGGLGGELAYMLGKISGSSHCALCDITHGLNPLGKPAWKEAAACISVPLRTVHLNEMDSRTATIVNGCGAPAIVLLSPQGDEVLLNADDIENCHKDPQKIVARIEAELLRRQ